MDSTVNLLKIQIEFFQISWLNQSAFGGIENTCFSLHKNIMGINFSPSSIISFKNF